MPKELPMQSLLFDAEQMAAKTTLSITGLQQELEDRGITMDNNGRVHVEIVGPSGGKALSASVIA